MQGDSRAEEKVIVNVASISENPIVKNLESPEKINGEVVCSKIDPFLWEEVVKKRDSVRQLMLNDYSLNSSLYLSYGGERGTGGQYYSSIYEEGEVYIKITDNYKISTSSLSIFQ